MCIYLKNNLVKFHPDPILNDEDLGFIKSNPNKNNNKNNGNMSIAIWDQFLVKN